MPGSNFDNVLKLDPQGRVAPRGPLLLDPGETLVEVYAWVTQRRFDGTGAFCRAEGEGDDVEPPAGPDCLPSWTTTDAEHQGRFLPGSAKGSGVTIARTKDGSFPRVYWWEEDIKLEAAAARTA